MNPDQTHDYRFFTCASCGHTFQAPVSCGNRFCDICSGPRRRKVKGKLNAIVRSLRKREGYGIKLMTLTIPNSVNANEGASTLIRSFRRLRQRRWFQNRCDGGAWVIEVTGEPGRWHVHLHVMLESRFLPHAVLSRQWSKVSPGHIVHIKALPSSAIIGYITAYISKSEVREADQVHLSQELKGFRLFQPFGTWHAIAVSAEKLNYCCPSCDHVGFYMNNSGYIPEKYGAKHPVGTLERALQDASLQKHPLPPTYFKNGKFHTN